MPIHRHPILPAFRFYIGVRFHPHFSPRQSQHQAFILISLWDAPMQTCSQLRPITGPFRIQGYRFPVPIQDCQPELCLMISRSSCRIHGLPAGKNIADIVFFGVETLPWRWLYDMRGLPGGFACCGKESGFVFYPFGKFLPGVSSVPLSLTYVPVW